ncbi:MAG: hypothetical protein ACT4PQ_11500 [Betaproteobacteria bacterium]
MNAKKHRIHGSMVCALTAIPLLVSTGALYAADYCCVCKGETKGQTISSMNRTMAVGQCSLECGSYANVSSGKCAEPPAAATPAPPTAQPTPAAPPPPTATAVAPVVARDFVAVAPGARVLADDGRIRVIDFQPASGTKVSLHSHPMTVVYLLEGGTTRFTRQDGTWYESVGRTGEAFISTPEPHSQEHKTASHAILFEIADAQTSEVPDPLIDLTSLAPGRARVLNENDRVRVYEYRAAKGDAVGMHSHSTHVVYLINAGKTQFLLPDGSTPKPEALKDGSARINPPVTHAQVHFEDVHAIIVELKR